MTSRASRGRGLRFGALVGAFLAATLVVSACGTSAAPRARGTAGAPTVAPKRAPTVSPCGPGTAGASDEIGVAPDSITIGVVADVSGARALFRANWDAVQAFAAYCNSLGGVAGRTLVAKLFDTNVFDHRKAITESCTSVFALVGSAAAFDGDGADVETDCGIPDVPALVAEPAHGRVPTVVAPLPNPQQLYLVGPLRYLAQVAPDAVKRSAMGYLDVGVTAVRATRQAEASRAVGYRFRVIDPIPALTSTEAIAKIADRIVARRAQYLTVQGSITDLAGLQTALAQRQYRPRLVDAGPLFYDPRYPRAAGSAGDGTYVLAQT